MITCQAIRVGFAYWIEIKSIQTLQQIGLKKGQLNNSRLFLRLLIHLQQ